MNPDTLSERLNDAINTIIRRDESAESGELLPSCVEGITFFWFPLLLTFFYLDPVLELAKSIYFLNLNSAVVVYVIS